MRNTVSERSQRDRGAAAVEFAIILPLLLLVIAGIIDMGRLFYGQIVAANAAREGARMSAIGYEEDDVIDTIHSWNLGGGLISADPPIVDVADLCKDNPGADTTVEVAYPNFDWIILDAASSFFGPSIAPPDPFASATMRCGG